MGNKNLIIVLVVVLLLVFGGAFFLLGNKQQPQVSEESQEEEMTAETLSPGEIGLTFTAQSDKKAVKFSIAKASDIEHVEYTIVYTKQVNSEEVPEGLIGEIQGGKSPLGIDYRILGTCSAKVCRYDTVVSDVTLMLKITKTNGKIYSVEDSLSLE